MGSLRQVTLFGNKNGYYLKAPKIDHGARPFFWVVQSGVFNSNRANARTCPFRQYLTNQPRFQSRSGNPLVVPLDSKTRCEAHIKTFIDEATTQAKNDFWKNVGSEMIKQLQSGRSFYLNT